MADDDTGDATARLFVAVRPPEDVLARLRRVPRPESPEVRWTPEDQWHVTLRFLGQARPGPVADALAGVAAPARAARLGPAVERLGRGVLMVPVAGLDDLATEVVHRTAELGDPPDDRPFRGHLTLGRLRARGGGRGRGRAGGGGRPRPPRGVVGAEVAATWWVGELELVRSDRGPDGARHTVVARFPLGPGPGGDAGPEEQPDREGP